MDFFLLMTLILNSIELLATKTYNLLRLLLSHFSRV